MYSNHYIPIICSMAQHHHWVFLQPAEHLTFFKAASCNALLCSWAVLRRKSGLDGRGTSCAGKGQTGEFHKSVAMARQGKIRKVAPPAFSQNIFLYLIASIGVLLLRLLKFVKMTDIWEGLALALKVGKHIKPFHVVLILFKTGSHFAKQGYQFVWRFSNHGALPKMSP